MEDALIQKLVSSLSVVAGGMVAYQLIFILIRRWSRKQKYFLPSLLTRHIYVPGMLLIVSLTLWAAVGAFGNIFGKHERIADHVCLLFTIGAVGFVLVRSITLAREIAVHHYESENPLDYSFRKAKTKFQLIQRVLNFIIVLAVVSMMMMTFKSVRQVGSTLLASAGVVGLIIGFAAQKSLGTLFAGVQIALSQPIRLDDVVVVEGEFGTIGEITLTYVVVNTWDGRRLVVPINYFLEKSFQSWTRSSPEVIAKVTIYADYLLPVEELREQFMKWINDSPLWDRRSSGLMLTGCDEKGLKLRATMSARNSGEAFDLECLVREKMIGWIRDNYPQYLPQSRVQLTNADHRRH